jgi:trimethylamine--corrinoid protein Co-methyltransferase
MHVVRPAITVLTREQIEKIHSYSLKILATTGIRVDSLRARKLFSKATGSSDVDRVVRVPAELVDWALEAAPSTVNIYDRRGNMRFQLGDAEKVKTRFGIGVTNLYYQDPATDALTAFTRKHMELGTRLGSVLPGYDIISTIGIIQDVSPQLADLYGTLEMIANTTKPLVILISEKQWVDGSLDLLEHLHGDLSAKPFIIPYVNPITPLVLNQDTADKIFSAIERGLPLIYNNYGMSGATSPITPAGNLALLNAELLAGLVFSQLVKKGTPIILGSLPAGFDMQSMAGLYTPETLMLNVACAEMMAYYDLPHSGTSGSGPGWGPDLSSAGTLWMNHLAGCLGKVGLAPFVGGNFDSMAFSPAFVVYSDEVIRQTHIFSQGFDINDGSVALNEIDSIGPGGNFLMADLTVALCRQTNFGSYIWPNTPLDEWQKKGHQQADGALRKHTQDLLDDLPIPADHADIIARGEKYIENMIT